MRVRNLVPFAEVGSSGEVVPPELLAACRRGDQAALGTLVRLTYRRSYGLALRLVGDRFDAEDIVQEAYLRMFRAMGGFREEARFGTWMHRIVTNVGISWLRRKGRLPELLSEQPPEPRAPDVPESNIAVRDELERALWRLPSGQRTVVVLKDIYDLSCREIAEELEIEEGAVKVRLHRARRRLRDVLSEGGRADEM
jgi:RNA polymerase sigma-70 factor (ECF subfamily)